MALPLAQGDSMPSLDDCPQTTPPNPSRAAGLPRNWWLLCVGITGWLQLECPAALRRNAHMEGQISQGSLVCAVDPCRGGTACRASCGSQRWAGRDHQIASLALHMLDNKPTR